MSTDPTVTPAGEQQPDDADQDALPALWCDPDEAHREQADGGEDAGLHVYGEDDHDGR
jgi:hypothetical protein